MPSQQPTKRPFSVGQDPGDEDSLTAPELRAFPLLSWGPCGHSGCSGVFPARGGSCSFEGTGKRPSCQWGRGQARQAQRQSPTFAPELHPLHMSSAHGAHPSRGPRLHGLLQPAASGPDSRGWASSLVTVDV